MIVTASSTAPRESKLLRRPTAVNSTGRPASVEAALQTVLAAEYFSDAGLSVGVATRHIEPRGGFVFQSPTHRLTAEAFGGQLQTIVHSPWPPHEHSVGIPGSPNTVTTILVTGLNSGVNLTEPISGLLNSTDVALGITPLAESKVAGAFATAEGEWFEDGIESRFSRSLSNLVFAYGPQAISAMESLLASSSSNTEVAVEAAEWLGEVDHPASRRYRRTLLEKLLLSSSTRLRHGAAAGLAAMDDPSALSAVVEARDRESNQRLRRFLDLVVEQLERTMACPSS